MLKFKEFFESTAGNDYRPAVRYKGHVFTGNDEDAHEDIGWRHIRDYGNLKHSWREDNDPKTVVHGFQHKERGTFHPANTILNIKGY